MKFQAVKGMKDIVPGEVEAWQVFEQKTRSFLEGYGFREIRTPLLESTELFTRSIGEASDIVHKEMYTFEDRGGRSLTLRPEMTASVARAAIENHLIHSGEPLYLYYLGMMYRAERPQAGRKREFYQLGVEAINTHSAESDAELIIMVKSYLEFIGLRKFNIRLNNLGTAEDKVRFAKDLSDFLSSRKEKLCEDCLYRLSKNVLRVFDCKVDSCRAVIDQAPRVQLSGEAGKAFATIQEMLTRANVPFQLEPKLVRGLDYYTGCVFEVTAEGLGAQDALLAGGRYDELIPFLGGPRVGASGFAMGIERLLMALEAAQVRLGEEALEKTVYVAAMVQENADCSFYRQIAESLTRSERRSVFSFSDKSLSSHLSRANKMKAAYVIIVGEEEYRAGEVALKDMKSGMQQRLKPSDLENVFKKGKA